MEPRERNTSKEGMSNAGHELGATLTGAQKATLLEYLKTL